MCEHDVAPTRRSFFKTLAVTVFAIITFPASLVRAKKVALSLASVEDLKTVGGSALLKIKDQDILFVRDTAQTVRAINPMCTHKKCKVAFKSEDGKLHCKCHKSAFELSGEVLGGPAKLPLQVYQATLSDDKIILTLPDAT
jgi:Rieske Fe-S protein